jgi:hypothetical protein
LEILGGRRGSVAAACQELVCGRDRTKEGAARRYFYGPVRLRAYSTPASEKRARRGPRYQRCAQGRLWKSGPDTNLIAAIPGRREAKASASRNPGSQNRAPGQPAG